MTRIKKENQVLEAVKKSAKRTKSKLNVLSVAIMLEACSEDQIEDMRGLVEITEAHGAPEEKNTLAVKIVAKLNKVYYKKETK